jgi:hypothetical protein
MIRALTTLVGFALAAAVLYFVPDAGNVIDDPVWDVPLVWAAAGLVAGVFYQAGGLRRPGMRANVSMLLFVFLPWTVVSASLVAFSTGDPSWLSDEARSVAGADMLTRWLPSLAAFAFGSGLLLAFSLFEPKVQTEADEVVERDVVTEPVVAAAPVAVVPAASSAPVATDETLVRRPETDAEREGAEPTIADDTLVQRPVETDEGVPVAREVRTERVGSPADDETLVEPPVEADERARR